MKKIALGFAALAFVGIGAAVAQVPALFLAAPTGQEQINVLIPTLNGTLLTGPQIESVKVAQLRDAAGYSKQAPLTGSSILIQNGTSRLVLNPAGTIAALTITLPSAPVDGQLAFIFTTQAITALTLQANTGQTLNNAITTMTANSTANYIYSAANATWDRA